MTNDIPTLRTDLNLDTRDNLKRSHLKMQQMVWFVDEQQNWVSKVLKRTNSIKIKIWLFMSSVSCYRIMIGQINVSTNLSSGRHAVQG